MAQISRRQFLTSAGGLVLASAVMPRYLRNALASGSFPSPGRPSGTVISQIKHVVVLMQENRSFDHYFGAMPGVVGFADKSVTPKVFKQPDPKNLDGYLLPFHATTHTTSAQALPSNTHDWGPQHESWNTGAMTQFITSRLTTYAKNDAQYSMAYFTQDDIPFHWALANAFTICDGYHCSVLGPTWPNRLYLMTGTIDPTGKDGGPAYYNGVPESGWSWQTYPEMLTAKTVSWRVYQENDNYGLNMLEYFNQYQAASPSSPLYQNALRFYPAGQFEHDAAHDKLPTVSWILPTSYQSEHPDYMPAAGADFIASKINAIASNPDVWSSTVFILVYDENDGLFDHVTPPTAPKTTPTEYITVDTKDWPTGPIGLGFRVPGIVVSPWTVGGYVSHGTFDHTSVIQLIERVTGVMNPNISTWRRKTVGDFTTLLGCQVGRFPLLPPTAANLEIAEQEVRRFQLPPIPGADQSFPLQGAGQKHLVETC